MASILEKANKRKVFQAYKHSFVTASLSILTCCPILVSAQTQMAGTINRMPIEKMKAEFDAKGTTYVRTVSKALLLGNLLTNLHFLLRIKARIDRKV